MSRNVRDEFNSWLPPRPVRSPAHSGSGNFINHHRDTTVVQHAGVMAWKVARQVTASAEQFVWARDPMAFHVPTGDQRPFSTAQGTSLMIASDVYLSYDDGLMQLWSCGVYCEAWRYRHFVAAAVDYCGAALVNAPGEIDRKPPPPRQPSGCGIL